MRREMGSPAHAKDRAIATCARVLSVQGDMGIHNLVTRVEQSTTR